MPDGDSNVRDGRYEGDAGHGYSFMDGFFCLLGVVSSGRGQDFLSVCCPSSD